MRAAFMSVRVRLAPSPTGPLHVGTARTALFNFLFARQHDGQLLLRIEDTDRERSRPEYEQEIFDGLRWLGVSWDEGPEVGGPHGPYRQSERGSLYRAAVDRLLREGKAYEDQGAILLRVHEQEIVVSDLVRGEVRFPGTEQRDFIIARTADDPLFHLAVVVDDAEMGVTHVIRGEDHLSNTPRHILLQRALGVPTPQYAHLPLLLDAERRKLSKRTAETGLLAYREEGYLPEVVVNFLALLGWNPKTQTEVFTIEDLVEHFDIAGVQKGGAVFARAKLDWLQRVHLRTLQLPTLAQRVAPYLERASIRMHPALLERALNIWRERGGVLAEVPEAVAFYAAPPDLVATAIPWRGTTSEQAREALAFASGVFERFSDEVFRNREDLQRQLLAAVSAAKRDRGTVLWPVRYALSGKRESPGPADIAWVLGKEETVRRLRHARTLLA
mgnify:CR=1 FL=1